MTTRKRHLGWNVTTRLLALGAMALATLACARITAFIPSRSSSEAQAAGGEAYAQGDYDQAIADYTDALTIDPSLSEAFMARGEVYYVLGTYDLAIADYSHALNLGYEPVGQLYSARSDAYFARGDNTLGTDDFAQARQLEAEFVDHYYPDRQAAFAQAIELHPDLASAYFARAFMETRLQDFQRAIADYTSAIELQQTPLMPALFWRGWANIITEDYPAALEDFTSAIELEPTTPDLYDARAHAYVRLADYDQALLDFKTAITVGPDYAQGHNNRCWFGSLLGHAADVMDSCERAVTLQPNIPAYRDSRGLGRALTGDYSGAIADFQNYMDFLAARGREDPDRAYWVAELQAGRNPFDEATLQALLGN